MKDLNDYSETPETVTSNDTSSTNTNNISQRKRQKSNSDQARKFRCDYPKCQKIFSRSDHLSRHKLNHAPTQIYKCNRCTKEFVRADLLSRHASRHDRREQIAASRNGGILPQKQQQQDNTTKVSSPAQRSSDMLTLNSVSTSPTTTATQIPSHTTVPSTSATSLPLATASTEAQPPLHHGLPNPYNIMPDATQSARHSQQPPQPPQPPQLNHLDLVTGFDKPMSQFDPLNPLSSPQVDLPPQAHHIVPHSQHQHQHQHQLQQQHHPPPPPHTIHPHHTQQSAQHDSPSPARLSGQGSPPNTNADINATLSNPLNSNNTNNNNINGNNNNNHSNTNGNENGLNSETFGTTTSRPPSIVGSNSEPSIFSGNSPVFPGTTGADSSFLDVPAISNTGFTFDDPTSYYGVGLEPSFFTAQDYMWLFDDDGGSKELPSNPMTPHPHSLAGTPGPSQQLRSLSKPSSPRDTSNDEPPPQQIDRSIYIDANTRQKLIRRLAMRQLSQDSHFSATSLQNYLHLYWTKFAQVQYPILHRPTFVAQDAPPLLLCAMICIGAYFANDNSKTLIDNVHDTLRGRFFGSTDFKPRAELWSIQTSLLIILYGKLCGTRPAHEMAHMFWGSCVTLYRRAALFTPRAYYVKDENIDDLETHWRAWISEESAKRAAFTAFDIDITHFALFRHSPTLSAFHVQLTLPASEEEWNAVDAREWHREHLETPPRPQFLAALKNALVSEVPANGLSTCGRVNILHGLMSVAFDLQWRELFMTGINPSDMTRDWKETLSAAYNRWKSQLDAALDSSTYPAEAILRNTVPLYAVAHMTISLDIHEIQIRAGAHHALGLSVPGHIVENTANKVKAWQTSKEGCASVWHAAHFIRSCLIHKQHIPDDLSGSLHIYVAYLACMCLYVFGGGDETGVHDNGTEISAMDYLNAMCTDTPGQIQFVPIKSKYTGLIKEVADAVNNAKWVIASEGTGILGRLLHKTDFQTRPTPTHQMISSGV